jgi:Cu+-exporting ATPase
LVGSGLAAKFGILVRGGGEAFQEAAQLDIVVFDKTGTITMGGEPKVTEYILDENSDKSVVTGTILALESASNHPLALALVEWCKSQGTPLHEVQNIEEIPGRGLKAHFSALDLDAIIGNERFMEENGVKLEQIHLDRLNEWKAKGESVVVLAHRSVNGTSNQESEFKVVGILGVADPLRPEARDVVQHIQQQGLSTWMISGDNETTAKAVAKMVGIPENNVIAGVLPHEKVGFVV